MVVAGRSNNEKTVTAVSEIVLSVDDLPTMREFYTSVVGFDLHREACMTGKDAPDSDEEATISFLKIADVDTPLGRDKHPQLLALIDWQRHVFAKSRFEGHDVKRSTLNHLAFEIMPEDFDSELPDWVNSVWIPRLPSFQMTTPGQFSSVIQKATCWSSFVTKSHRSEHALGQ